MKILIVVKPHSDNFIRHYYKNMDNVIVLKTKEWQYAAAAIKDHSPDVVLYEWANDLTAACVNHIDHKNIKVVVRVHDHEVQKGRIHAINWKLVNAAWFINPHIREQFFSKIHIDLYSFYLPNAVDANYFSEKCMPRSAKTIGLLSIYPRPRKRIDRAIKMMEYLPDWTLYIRTDPSGMPQEYEMLREISVGADNVKWDLRSDEFTYNGYDYQDVNEFFQDKCVVLSTSDHEGFHYAVAEGMCCGCQPVVYNWESSRNFWGGYVYDNIRAMAAAIRGYIPSVTYRKYVEINYSPQVLVPDLLKKLNEIQ